MNALQSKAIITILLFFLFISLSYSQEAVIPAGGNAIGSSGSVSYTIGQIGYTTDVTTNYSMAAGVQQPFEISVLSVDETLFSYALKVYPNPTTDALILDIKDFSAGNLTYTVSDIDGRFLSQQKITVPQTAINFVQLPNGVYFIKVDLQGKNIKTFKIIKK